MRKNIDVQEVILKTILVAGVISLAVMAPNCVQLLAPLVKDKRKYRYYVNTRVKSLAKKGLIKIERDGKETMISLTAKGERQLAKAGIKQAIELRNKKWDSKWRVVIFDIKEYKRGERNWLRAELSEFGFIRLQNSVWVTPYDCEEFVDLLKADIGLGREVIYMVVEHIENDKWIKKEFDLD